MKTMSKGNRAIARKLAQEHMASDDPLGWFEELYSLAGGNASIIPWADLEPNPSLIDWLDRQGSAAKGVALKIGSGLGDDAEELARRGFDTTAFDISNKAIVWSRTRFPQSPVSYVVADLFSAPSEWEGRFGFVLESYTLQVLPPDLRADAMHRIASFVAPGGTLLVITRGREPSEPEGFMPWPLKKEELSVFGTHGPATISFEDYRDSENPPVRRFRATYRWEDGWAHQRQAVAGGSSRGIVFASERCTWRGPETA
jgi:hypothetical protein